MKVVAIIQARMGSARLPGKILKEVLGKPLLEYQIERVKRAMQIDNIVLATTTNNSEQPIIKFCEKNAIPYYRGSEEDVLSRYYEAAKEFKADVVVRLTSDCPIIDPTVIDTIIMSYVDGNGKFDYVSNTIHRTYPRGYDVEVFSFSILEEAHKHAKSQTEREHVTPFIHQQPSLFALGYVLNDIDISEYRLTVDTMEDFLLIEKIIQALYQKDPEFSHNDVINLLNDKQDWLKINANITQKEI